MEEELGLFAFYARVPSKSNVADAPSRLDFRGLPPDKRIADAEVIRQLQAMHGAFIKSSLTRVTRGLSLPTRLRHSNLRRMHKWAAFHLCHSLFLSRRND